MKNVMLALILCLLAACASSEPDASKTIHEQFASRLRQVKIGMTTEQFQSLFSEAYPAGQNRDMTAYELSRKYIAQRDNSRPLDAAVGIYKPRHVMGHEALWFYFIDDKLIRWGRPQDWSERPDVIIEKRER